MRVLFLPLITGGAARGTISRCLAVAEHLRLLGHEALFLTGGESAKEVAEAGFPFMVGAVPDPPGPLHPLCDLSDVAVFLNLTSEEFLLRSLETERRAVETFRPDILFSEFKLTAPLTAAMTGLPLASTACSPADPRFISPLFREPKAATHEQAVSGLNHILSQLGQAPISDVAELFFMRSGLKIAPTVLDLEPLLADVADLYYVGYLLHDRMELAPLPHGLLDEVHGRSLVFVYFSTGEIGPEHYVRVIPEAFDGTEFYAIVATGDHPELPELPRSSSNVKWVRTVPGRSILRCSQAVIFHGGQNTAVASLIHKVPSLVFPGEDFERDFNARSLAAIRAGLHLAVEDFTPERVLDATRSLLSPSFGLALETYSWKVLRQGGARYAADLLMKVIQPDRGNTSSLSKK